MAKKLLFRGGREEGKMFRGDPLSDLKKRRKGGIPAEGRITFHGKSHPDCSRLISRLLPDCSVKTGSGVLLSADPVFKILLMNPARKK